MSNYDLTLDALSDLREISAYTQREWGRQQRLKYLETVENCFGHLADMPGIGRDVSHMRKGLCAYPCGTHVIFYRQESAGITVIRILHQSQSAIRAFSRGTPNT